MSLYRKIFKRSLSLTWHNKYLWFFGLFAAILGGLGKYEISLNRISGDIQEGFYPSVVDFLNSKVASNLSFPNVVETFQNDPLSMMIIVGLFLIIGILAAFILWLSIVSQVGLVNNSANIIKSNKKYSSLKIKDGVAVGMKHFWPVLGWNFIIKTLIYVLFAILSLPLVYLIANGSSSINSLLYILLFIVFIPAALILSLILKYSICYIVIKGKGFVDAFVDSWNLFLRNWLISLEMAGILFVIQFLATIAILLIILALAIPFIFLVYLVGAVTISLAGKMMFVGVFLGVALSILVGAIFTTFQISSWTGLFLELTGKRGALSKLIRLTAKKKKGVI